MNELSNMPNIGKTLEALLIQADIQTPEALTQIGSKEAFVRLRSIDSTACLNKLYALEGAIQNLRWHYLPQETKADLKAFFRSMGKYGRI